MRYRTLKSWAFFVQAPPLISMANACFSCLAGDAATGCLGYAMKGCRNLDERNNGCFARNVASNVMSHTISIFITLRSDTSRLVASAIGAGVAEAQTLESPDVYQARGCRGRCKFCPSSRLPHYLRMWPRRAQQCEGLDGAVWTSS